MVGDVFGQELLVRAGKFAHEFDRVFNLIAVNAVASQTDNAKVLISHHNGIGSAPFLICELFGIHEIDFAGIRGFKGVFPAVQRGKNGQVFGVEFISAGRENVGDFAFHDEDANLRFSDGQL